MRLHRAWMFFSYFALCAFAWVRVRRRKSTTRPRPALQQRNMTFFMLFVAGWRPSSLDVVKLLNVVCEIMLLWTTTARPRPTRDPPSSSGICHALFLVILGDTIVLGCSLATSVLCAFAWVLVRCRESLAGRDPPSSSRVDQFPSFLLLLCESIAFGCG